eukprot:120587-Pleurochrysis_carterae.AAC.1
MALAAVIKTEDRPLHEAASGLTDAAVVVVFLAVAVVLSALCLVEVRTWERTATGCQEPIILDLHGWRGVSLPRCTLPALCDTVCAATYAFSSLISPHVSQSCSCAPLWSCRFDRTATRASAAALLSLPGRRFFCLRLDADAGACGLGRAAERLSHAGAAFTSDQLRMTSAGAHTAVVRMFGGGATRLMSVGIVK